MPIHFPLGKYKFSIRSFLEYYYTIVLMYDISYPSKRIPSKGYPSKRAQISFSPDLDNNLCQD